MKTFVKICGLICIALVCFVIQIYALNKMKFFGVVPNILLAFCVVLSIWEKPNISIPITLIFGIFNDMFFTFSLGKYVITYMLLNLGIIMFSKLYNKYNNISTIIILGICSILFEYILGIYNLIKYAIFQNIFSITLVGVIGAIINIILGIILTAIIKRRDKKENIIS